MTSTFVSDITRQARHRWPAILSLLSIPVPAHHRHGPCPVCGGQDRFRMDDREGRGTWYCNRCGAGDGLDLVVRVHRCSLAEAARRVASLESATSTPPAREKARPTVNIAARVNALLARCVTGESPYLKAKGYDLAVPVLSAGQTITVARDIFPPGSLVLALQDIIGQLTGVQLVSPAGTKHLLPGSHLKGAFVALPPDATVCPQAGSTTPATEDIAITEGYATALAVRAMTGMRVCAALSANNLLNVAGTLREAYPQARLILAADNDRTHPDNPGKLQAVRAACTVNGVVVLPLGEATDHDDALRLYGPEQAHRDFYRQLFISHSDFYQESATMKPGITPVDRHSPELTTSLPLRRGSEGYDTPQNYLIKGHIPGNSLSSIYGPGGSFKSFLAVSWACHIATGKPWAQQRVNQGAVIYVAGEGGIGVPRRIRAWEQTLNGNSPVDSLFRVDCAVFPASPESVRQVIQAAADVNRLTALPVRLIILDTLARCFGGSDENAARDMGAFIQGCDAIRTATQASVLIVHHSGKDQDRGARGSSAFQAALDAEFNVRREGEGHSLVLSCTKMKDAEPPEPAAYDLSPVTVYVDEDGEPVDSLVLHDQSRAAQDPTVVYPELAGVSHLTGNHIAVWQALLDLGDCTRTQLRQALRPKGINADKKFSRWLLKLEKEGLITLHGENICLTITTTR